MNSPSVRVCLLGLLTIVVLLTCRNSASAQIPNPVLYLTHTEYVVVNGNSLARYHYDVMNKEAYPAAMFAAAPGLPPCGSNTNSSRSWVDIFDQRGKRLNGFCALGSPKNLNDLWFAIDVNEIPPSWIYIEINDRQTNTKYKSNLADTTQ